MLHVNTPHDLGQHVGHDLGASHWRVVDQAMIDAFSAVSGDTHWLHTDPQPAAREGPFGGTVAHGFLTLSLLTAMMSELIEIGGASHFVNYGLDRVRFTGVVRAGDRVRLQQTLAAVTPVKGGVRLTMTSTMQIEGSERPALVADFIFMAFT
jgi:acyl dehydratase